MTTEIKKELADLKELISRQNEDIEKASAIITDYQQSYNRSQYLLENAVSYIKDNDLLKDFIEDRDIDFTSEERSYFELGDTIV